MARLAGRRVLITGASSGIGRAAAHRFAAAGADLALIARGVAGLEDTAAVAREHGAQVHVLPADVTDRPALEQAVAEAAARLGGLDVVVTGAGAAAHGAFRELPKDDFDRTFDVVFRGSVDTARAALPHLVRSRGVLIGIVSVLSRFPTPLLPPYVAAKHALRGFYGSLRVEMLARGTGVRVCMVHPGPVDTPFWTTMPSTRSALPALPPGSYSAGTVACAIVRCAEKPTAELVVGGAMVPLEAAFALAKPLTDRVLALVARAYPSGPPAPGRARSGLHRPVGEIDAGEHGGRPSVWAALRRPGGAGGG